MEFLTFGVVGAGTMGAGIALTAAKKGLPTTLYDLSREQLERARGEMGRALERDVQKGRLSQVEAQGVLDRVLLTLNMEELAGAGLVVEAVVEKLEVKGQVFARLDAICSDPATVLATNTSSLSVTEIARFTQNPRRVIGLHFFNPAPVMPLVEVVEGALSDPQAVAKASRFMAELGKTAVRVKDTPGFIVNRVARPFYNEALRIMGQGVASPAAIDRIMKKAGGFKMGPFELQDLIGLDINFATTHTVHQGFFGEPRFRPSLIQQRMVQAGRLGRKTGGGFYEYPGD